MTTAEAKLRSLYDADHILNINICRITNYTFAGLGAGLLLCPLFKNKTTAIIFAGGIGAGFAFNELYKDLNTYNSGADKQ